MGTTLENGVYLPSEGERNCYAGLKTNWEILDQKVADVTALQQAVAGALHREIVESLPTTDIDPNTIYMVLSGTSATENVYNEFMYVNNAWELIGTSATDLTNYYTKGEVDGLLLLKANASDLTSHTGDTTIHVTASDKNKWNNQTYVFRYSSTAITDNSTIAYSTIDNTDNIKSGDKILDVDGKLFEITAVDTTNQTVTVGSALIDLALDANVVHTNEINSSGIGIIEGVKEVGGVDFNTLTTQGLYGTNASGSTNNPVASPCVVQVIRRLNNVIQIANVSSSSAYKSRYIRYCVNITAQPPVWQSWIKFATDDEVVHKSGDENVNGIKNFKNMIPIDGDYLGNEASVNQRTNICLRSNRDTADKSCAYISRFRQNKSQGALQTGDFQMIGFDVLENEVRTNNVFSIQCSGWVDNVPTKVKFLSTSSDSTFGSSARPSKINDLNPSSLGMPDLSNGIDISSYITHLDKVVNSYTPTVNGYVFIRVRKTSLPIVSIRIQQNYGLMTSCETSDFSTWGTYLPVVAGKVVEFYVSADSLGSAIFFPCQGNV